MPRKKSDDVKYWEERLAAEGLTPEPPQIPPWHTGSPPAAAKAIKGAGARTAVQLPSDWEDGAQPDFANRVLSTAINREISGVLNARLEEYVWREARWRDYPDEHRVILEAYVVDGPSDAELSDRIGVSVSTVTRVLRLHRMLANVTLEDVDDVVSQVRQHVKMSAGSRLLWTVIAEALPALRRFE